jgi:hypothetical protein
MESSAPAHTGDTAILESSPYVESGPLCTLQFWYNMYGAHMGSLKVQIKTANDAVTPLWSITGNQQNVWHNASVTIGPNFNFVVMLVAVRGNSFTSDIAVDDISFSNCAPGRSFRQVIQVYPMLLMIYMELYEKCHRRCYYFSLE